MSSSSCAPVFTVVSDRAFMLAEEAPAVALASGASLPPPSCDVLSDIVVDGHREAPVRAGKPAREGVVFEGTFAGELRTTRFVCTTSGGYLTECCGDEPDGRSSFLSRDAPCDASLGLSFFPCGILPRCRATVAGRRGFEFLSGAVGVAVPCSFGNRLPGAVVASVLAARGLRPTFLGFLTSKSRPVVIRYQPPSSDPI
jgi:hypothetical protein